MKLKNYFLPAIILMAGSIASCKKSAVSTAGSTNSVANAALAVQVIGQSDDQSRVSTELDNITIDANIAIESSSTFSGRVQNVLGALCNASTVTDTSGTAKTLTINYNGLNCTGNRFYKGVVILSMPKGTKWKDAGAVLTITKQNLKITRVRDTSSITLNGVTTITNVSGGRLTDLATGSPITYTVASDGISILFDNGTSRNWQVAQKRVFSYNNGIVVTTTGTHTENGVSGIAEWGVNRLGNAFETAITQPIVVRQDCNYRVVSGEVTHRRLASTIVVTDGLDVNGLATGCPGNGTYYYKIVWTDTNNNIKTVILPY